jgi:hypothetical protein
MDTGFLKEYLQESGLCLFHSFLIDFFGKLRKLFIRLLFFIK